MIGQRKSLRIVGGTDIPQPTFEATLDEKLVIKRFLDFALADIKFQFQEMKKAIPFDLREMEHHQSMAVALSNYVWALKGGVDEMHVGGAVGEATDDGC